jgi:hypothetical protein
MGGIRVGQIVGRQAFMLCTAGAGVLMVGAGCRAPATVGDAAALSRQLRTEFHRPAAVSLDGQRRLIVTMEANSTDSTGTTDDSTSSDAGAQAFQIARFVGSHYQHAGALKAVTVILEAPAGDSAGQPSMSSFSAAEINPVAARPVAPGTKSD